MLKLRAKHSLVCYFKYFIILHQNMFSNEGNKVTVETKHTLVLVPHGSTQLYLGYTTRMSLAHHHP
jgi:5-formaminoimidazole-4-carboxamide-1-beta-D-ribofuranosyl 5'-monophosphate synthetase